MMDVGRLCVKIAGRDAGKKCVIIEVIDDKFVMVDGETRRRKCNVKHLEPLKEMLKISKGATHEAVKAEFKKLGIDIKDTKPKPAKPKKRKVRSAERKKMLPKAEKKTENKKSGAPAAKAAEKKPADKSEEAEGTKLEKAIEEEK